MTTPDPMKNGGAWHISETVDSLLERHNYISLSILQEMRVVAGLRAIPPPAHGIASASPKVAM
jgi:hypothetical protein